MLDGIPFRASSGIVANRHRESIAGASLFLQVLLYTRCPLRVMKRGRLQVKPPPSIMGNTGLEPVTSAMSTLRSSRLS